MSRCLYTEEREGCAKKTAQTEISRSSDTVLSNQVTLSGSVKELVIQ